MTEKARAERLKTVSDRLKEKRDAKKEIQARLGAEEREKQQQAQFLAADKAAREEQYFGLLQEGAERQLVARTKALHQANEVRQSELNKETTQRKLNATRTLKEKRQAEQEAPRESNRMLLISSARKSTLPPFESSLCKPPVHANRLLA
jgi:hypothetical protein